MAQEDISVAIKRLRDSKARIQQLQDQLDKEKANGKQLYEAFMQTQADLQDVFGISVASCRKRSTAPKHKTADVELRLVAARTIKRALADGKSGGEAKELTVS